MPYAIEQLEIEKRRRDLLAEKERRQPQGEIQAFRKPQLPGVWDYDKRLDALLGDGNLEDYIPMDVKYDFGRIIKMTQEPTETEDKIKLSVLYKSIADISPRISFNMMDELNRIIVGHDIKPSAMMKRYKEIYADTKTWTEAIKHGYRRAGVMMTKQLAGLARMEVEVGGKIRNWFWGALGIEKPQYQKKTEEILKEWSDMMLAGVNEYYQTHKDEAIQILPGLGYRETLMQYIFEPKNLIQGIIESSPLVLEGILGTVFGGSAAAITTMAIPITGEVYAGAREEGTEPLPALAQSVLTGVGEAAIEQWTLSRKLGLMKNFKTLVADGLPKILWEGVKAFFRGTAEEGTQEFNRNFWQWVFTDRSQQWLDNVKESMAAGGPMEMVMAGAFSSVGAMGGAVAKEQQAERLDKIAEAVETEPTLTEEHKVEIREEIDKAGELIEQEQFEVAAEEMEKELAEIQKGAMEEAKPPAEQAPEIITDAARVQEIKNSIAEGELILKTGKFHGRKFSTEKLEAVRRQVEKEKASIGESAEQAPGAEKAKKPIEKKAVETPVQKYIKAEKEVIPKVSQEKFTSPEVQKETKAKTPASDSETQNAVNLLEAYWKEFDERELEINVEATKNQESIAKALDKKLYLPESDIDTSKTSQAMMLYIDLKEHPSGHKFAEQLSKLQREIYELSQNLPAGIRKIADNIIEQNRKAGALAVDKEIIAVARENYIAHLWRKPTRKEALRAKFRQKTARAKARTLEGGIMEGWAKGKELRVKDVTLATQIAQSQINQAIVGREMLKMGKKWGLLSHKQPEGWIRVEHPGFTTWKWSGKAEKAKTYGKNFFVTEEGDLMERVPVYAEPVLGKKLNNVFSPSALYKVPGIETISRYNAQIKSTILFTSLFHHQAFLRSYAFGSRGLNPKEAYEKGNQAIMNMTPEVRLLVRNGLTIGRIQDYDPRMIEGEQTIWGRALSYMKLTEAIREKFVALRNRQARFLFNKLGPALKIQAGILELRATLKRNQIELESGEITADEVAAAVSNLMNNDFGGLHLGRMGRSQTAQHLFRLLALAPDWTESNIRSAIDAFRKGETGYMHRMFWGRIAIKGLGATILFNLLLSAFDDDDFVKRYKKAWKAGRLKWLDIDITPIYKAMGGSDDKRKYFSLLGHFRDPVKFTAHPIVSAKHKGSVVSRIMLDMMIGEDWAGRKYTTIGELTGLTEDGKYSGRLVRYAKEGARPIEPSQIPSYALYEVRSAMPIPMQNILAFLGGEMDAFDAITKSAGLMVTTAYPERKRKAKKIRR